MTKYFIFPLFLLLFYPLKSQNISRTFGGNDSDKGYAMDRLATGEFYLAGSVESFNGDAAQKHQFNDAWIIKCDAQFNIIWQQKLGGLDLDEAYGIAVATDGGCVVVGQTLSDDSLMADNHGDIDGWIAKYAPDGTREWLKLVGGTAYEALYAVRTTTDGGYITVGQASSQNGDVVGGNGQWDMWVVKFSETGELEWQKPLGGTDLEIGFDIRQTTNGDYIAVGNARSDDGDVSGLQGEWDIWVVKLSQTGNLIWQKMLGGTGADGGYSIQEMPNIGYIVAGWTASQNDGDVQGNHGSADAWIVRLDANGNLIGQNTLGGTSSEQAKYISLTSDGWVAVGDTRSIDGDIDGNAGLNDAWIAKWSSAGNLLGVQRIAGSKYDLLYQVIPLNDNSFVALGWTDSQDGDIDSTKGLEDFWILQTNTVTAISVPTSDTHFNIYPNPAQDVLSICVSSPSFVNITDIIGEICMRFEVLPNIERYNISSLANGMFFLQNEKTLQVIKFMKE